MARSLKRISAAVSVAVLCVAVAWAAGALSAQGRDAYSAEASAASGAGGATYTVTIDAPWAEMTFERPAGEEFAFTLTPAEGTVVTSVTVDGDELTPENGVYVLTVTSDVTVVVTGDASSGREPTSAELPIWAAVLIIVLGLVIMVGTVLMVIFYKKKGRDV